MFKNILKIATLISLILLIAALLYIIKQLDQPHSLLNPENKNQVLSSSHSSTFLSAEGSSSNKSTTDNRQLTTKTNNYQIIGFLPYWLLNQADHIQYDKLTQIAYFGIEFDDQGEILTELEDGTQELGYRRLYQSTVSQVIRRSRESQTQPILTVKILNNDGIQAAISPEHRSQIINQITTIMQQRNFTGLNIDFEYIKSPQPETQSQFTEFIKELRKQLDNYKLTTNNYQLSLDIYSDTAAKQTERLWQLADLVPYIDHFIVMGYDFHRSTTPKAGPVAPIHGSPLRWEEDLGTSLSQISQLVPPEKIILGVPYYGYEWRTYTSQPNSTTYRRSGQLASYSRVREFTDQCHSPNIISTLSLLNSKLQTENCQLYFDPDALSPYIIYQDGNKYQQIWFENTESLQHKYQLVKEANLAGIAIWALGYDAPHDDLWNLIEQEFYN